MQLKAVAIPAAAQKVAPHKDGPPTPKGLSAEARRLWHALRTDYEISDSAGLLLLETAMRSYDRALQARKTIAVEGAIVLDRFGQRKPHPLLALERDARLVMMKALQELHLDVEAVGAVGRPPGR